MSKFTSERCIYATQSDWINNKQSIKFLVFVARKCNKIFYVVVSNGNLTLVFHPQVAAIKTDESVTLVHTVRIKDELTSFLMLNDFEEKQI